MDQKIVADILQWDVTTWSVALRYWEKDVDWNKVQNALELGGREGGLSLWFALKGKPVICSDLLNTKATAEALHKKYNITLLISYEDINATAIPYENTFDVIVFKSIIGGIGYGDNKAAQQAAFDQIYKALKPGGKLLFAENLTATWLHRKLRSRFVGWGSAWRYITEEELYGFLGKFSSKSVLTTGVVAVFGRTEGQKQLLSWFDRYLFNWIFPSNWKYVGYGVAVK